MTEIPSDQSEKESLPLRQQKLREHLNDAHLSETETIAIIGSRLKTDKDELGEDLESGAITDEEFKRYSNFSTRALAIIDKWDPNTNLYAEADRKRKNVLQLLNNYNPDHPVYKTREAEAEALRMIMAHYQEVAVDNPQLEYVNSLIREHNLSLESPEQKALREELESAPVAAAADVAPEPEDSQAERAAAARRQIEKIFNPESKEQAAEVLAEVLKASEGSALIHTDMPEHGSRELVQAGKPTPGVNSGFQTLGERWGKATPRYDRFNIPADKVAVESVFFKHITEPVYEMRTLETRGGLFGRKAIQTEQKVKTGERAKTMRNDQTGEDEPAVEVQYQFVDDKSLKSPAGNEAGYATLSGRMGNMLIANIQLPESVAARFKEAVAKDPSLARQLAKELAVSDRTGLTEEDWSVGNSASGGRFKVEPPYEALPANWTLSVYDEDNKTESEIPFS